MVVICPAAGLMTAGMILVWWEFMVLNITLSVAKILLLALIIT
jgi:hypothetical protein